MQGVTQKRGGENKAAVVEKMKLDVAALRPVFRSSVHFSVPSVVEHCTLLWNTLGKKVHD